MARPYKQELHVTEEQRAELDRLIAAHTTPQSLARRARIIVLLDSGLHLREVGEQVGTTHQTVAHWRNRFIQLGMHGLRDAPRSGRPRTISDERVADVVMRTLESTPKAQTHWSRRLMAKEVGMSADTIGRIWRAFGLKPHLTESFRLSDDPEFLEKLYDVVGLYLSPPTNALVLSVDEKPQIQAKQDEVAVLPMQPGSVEGHSSQYKRHGTTVLFAALEVATGRVVASCKSRRRTEEFVEFLAQIERQTPEGVQLHLILDNLNTHKSVPVQTWLLEHSRVHLHFVPTYSSWLNLVESFFAQIQRRVIDRGSFTSVEALERALLEYIERNNEDPKPFKWTKTAEQVLASLERRCLRTLRSTHGSFN